MIDLHMHSTASDGQYTPKQLVQKAFERKISVMSITDHDTYDGLEEGAKEAEKLGIIFVPGIELNIERPGCEFHLLGLGLYKISDSLRDVVKKLQNSRNLRNQLIIEKMNADGVKACVEDVQNLFPNQVIGRPHFAAWLCERGIVKNRQEAFDKYLTRGKPWYVDRIGANLDEAVMAIRESGGVSVVAHPLSLYLSWRKMEGALAEIRDRGVSGIEAYHPGARFVECQRLEKIAENLGMFVTAGSDFHGEAVRRDRKPGITAAEKKIDDRFWFEELKPALEKNRESEI